jgi:hypothetical protein
MGDDHAWWRHPLPLLLLLFLLLLFLLLLFLFLLLLSFSLACHFLRLRTRTRPRNCAHARARTRYPDTHTASCPAAPRRVQFTRYKKIQRGVQGLQKRARGVIGR